MIRYYKGLHEVKIIFKGKQHAFVEWLDNGTVGSKQLGYKPRNKG